MRKNKKYLTLLIIILGFLIGNCASASTKLLKSREEATSSPINITKPEPVRTQRPPESSLVPALVQQEINKAKALRKRTASTKIPGNNSPIINQTPTKTNTPNTIEEQIPVTKVNASKQKSNRNNKIKDRRTEQIKRYVRNVARRFKVLINREYQIKTRIQTRIGKLEENGFEMSSARQLLSETDTSFETIKNQIESLRDEIKTTIESPSVEIIKNLFEKIRTKTIFLKKEVRNSHIKLVQTVKIIRKELTTDRQNQNKDSNSKTGSK